MIPNGERSKCLVTSSSICSTGTVSVPKVSTSTETGLTTPMAYATWISHLEAIPAATMFLATQRAP